MKRALTRRDLLRLAAASGALVAMEGCGSSADALQARSLELDFSTLPDGEGWDAGWTCPGVATLTRENGQGVLLAGSDIFPNDPRPVAFAVDARFVEGSIRAVVTRSGRSVGVVLRRTSIRTWYAAVYDADTRTLAILRRTGFDLVTLAQTIVLLPPSPMTLEFAASGRNPTQLSARLIGAQGAPYEVKATDDTAELQQAGDAGVFAQADTLLPDSNPVVPALGNLHLLPYSVQEGQAVIATPVGQVFIDTIRRRSTAAFARIEIVAASAFEPSAPSIVAATTGAPAGGGAMLHVASDLPAEVSIEVAQSADFAGSRLVDAGATDPQFLATATEVAGVAHGATWWRSRLRRGTLETVGPTRRFRALPPAGDATTYTIAYGACASQFNAIFDQLAARNPDVFVWQGDLNYADTHGPFAQTMAGYAGIWRHFLDNPRIAPILERCAFVAGRDDHDYGLQDANADHLLPWGLAPWDALINPRAYQKISAGLAASTAPFQVICSACTVAPAPGANARDGSWATGFTAERDLILAHIAANVGGQVVFLTGDTHFTMVWDRDGLFEARACPLDIPTPNDQNISNPLLELSFGGTPGVVYWSRRSHFSFLTIGGEGDRAVMNLEVVRDDGVSVWSRRFERAS